MGYGKYFAPFPASHLLSNEDFFFIQLHHLVECVVIICLASTHTAFGVQSEPDCSSPSYKSLSPFYLNLT